MAITYHWKTKNQYGCLILKSRPLSMMNDRFHDLVEVHHLVNCEQLTNIQLLFVSL